MQSAKAWRQKRVWNKRRLDGPKTKHHRDASRRRKTSSSAQYWKKTIVASLFELSNDKNYYSHGEEFEEEPPEFALFVRFIEDAIGGTNFVVNKFSERKNLKKRMYRGHSMECDVSFRVVIPDMTPLPSPEIWCSLVSITTQTRVANCESIRVYRKGFETLDAVLSDIANVPREVVSVISAFCNSFPTREKEKNVWSWRSAGECWVRMEENGCPYLPREEECVCTCHYCMPMDRDWESPEPVADCVQYGVHESRTEVLYRSWLNETVEDLLSLVKSTFMEESLSYEDCPYELMHGLSRGAQMKALMNYICQCAIQSSSPLTRVEVLPPEIRPKFSREEEEDWWNDIDEDGMLT